MRARTNRVTRVAASPCAPRPGGACKACTAAQAGANGYQFMPGGPVCAARCIPLALPNDLVASSLLDATDPSAGVVLTFGGGEAGRQLIHQVKCKAGAPLAPVGLVCLLSVPGTNCSHIVLTSKARGCSERSWSQLTHGWPTLS